MLPGADRAVLDPSKILGYLLDLEHPVGRGKARLFRSLGFTRERWWLLADALLQHASQHPVHATRRNPFGLKYIVRGTFHGTLGRSVHLESVWIVLDGEDAPRFVTAYPHTQA